MLTLTLAAEMTCRMSHSQLVIRPYKFDTTTTEKRLGENVATVCPPLTCCMMQWDRRVRRDALHQKQEDLPCCMLPLPLLVMVPPRFEGRAAERDALNDHLVWLEFLSQTSKHFRSLRADQSAILACGAILPQGRHGNEGVLRA